MGDGNGDVALMIAELRARIELLEQEQSGLIAAYGKLVT
jgi:hypothetical protein